VVLGVAVILVLASNLSINYITSHSPTTSDNSMTQNNTSTSTNSSTTSSFKSAFVVTTSTTSTTDIYQNNWLTYHQTNLRDGFEINGVSSFHSAREFWLSPSLDGVVYAEPLVFNNTIYVATEGDSVYALNETNGEILWRTNFGTPVPASEMDVPVSCSTIDPMGITGTPVIDPLTGALYAVGFVMPGKFNLYAIEINNGHLLWKEDVTPKGMNPLVEQQRSALAIANGYVYIGFGGNAGDCGQYNGYLQAAPENDSGNLITYEVPATNGGPIWAPSGPAIDGAGDVYIATGNSNSTTSFDYGNAVIKLSPTLQVLGYFAPTDWASDNLGDLDLGSSGPAFLNSNTIFQIGKEGVGYLLNKNNLDGIGGEEYSGDVCYQGQFNGGSFGGVSYDPPYLFVPCIYTGIIALKVDLDPSPSFSLLWKSTGFFAGAPIVADGAVWTVKIENLGENGLLYALNPASGSIMFSVNIGAVGHFITPAADRNLIFVGGNQSIWAFSVS
jgi:outer membrane protein assembly factor BamB